MLSLVHLFSFPSSVFHSPGDDAGEAVQLTELDAKALLQVSIEHENSENSSSKAHCGLVNEVTKQQVVVQFLEVRFPTKLICEVYYKNLTQQALVSFF